MKEVFYLKTRETLMKSGEGVCTIGIVLNQSSGFTLIAVFKFQ